MPYRERSESLCRGTVEISEALVSSVPGRGGGTAADEPSEVSWIGIMSYDCD